MITGVIKTKDVLLHPWTIISMKGFRGFCKLLVRAMSRKPYQFIQMVENTQWLVCDKNKPTKLPPH